MCECFMHVHMCTTQKPGASEGQKRTLDPLKMELQMIFKSPLRCWGIKSKSPKEQL